MLADYHVHTCYSDDSQCLMENMILQGLKNGLDEIAFTEHVDYGIKTDLNCNYPSYFKAVEIYKKKYAGKITLKTGIEFGVQSQTIPLFQKDFETWPFDFIILSNHQVDNKEFWNYQFQEGKSQEEFHRAYYEAIYNVVQKYKNYSVLGHLDMIKRYDDYGNYPDNNIMDIIEKILRQVISDGKGIEINTSSFKYGLNDLMPSKAILKCYHKLGGKIITIGSDTHDAEHLGDHIRQVSGALKELGFTHFCTFEKMQPTYLLL
ncbi:MAG: histidinol-phosphatase HisJ family protein [Eubacteriales bacterium]|nr:histidinol-phosphatase HisJ family protein [Eubacteriales bacterium]